MPTLRQCLLPCIGMGITAATLCADLIPTPPEPPPPPEGGNFWAGIALAIGICLGGLWLVRRMRSKPPTQRTSHDVT